MVRPIPPGSNLPALREPRRRNAGVLVGWISLLVVVVLAIILGVTQRDRLVALWPPLERAYAAVGWPVPVLGEGLELRVPTTVRRTVGEGELIEVVGEIANTGDEPRQLPAVRISLLDTDRQEVATQIYSPKEGSLPAGETSTFAVAFAERDRPAVEIEVRFTRRTAP